MVAISLSVLAFTGGIAAGHAAVGQSPQSADAAFDSAPLVLQANAPVHAAGAISWRGDQAPIFKGLSLDVAPAPFRSAMTFGVPVSVYDAPEPMELSVSASTGFSLDVGLAQRTVHTDLRGASVTGQGTEVRIGQGLGISQDNRHLPYHSGWYLFAASDGRAVTWTPASDPSRPGGALRLENGVQIGDIQAGVAMSRGALQTSFSVVKRTVKSFVGPFRTSADGSFAGITLSWRK
jgi:hypothetical protein